jgi:hypothetical protein
VKHNKPKRCRNRSFASSTKDKIRIQVPDNSCHVNGIEYRVTPAYAESAVIVQLSSIIILSVSCLVSLASAQEAVHDRQSNSQSGDAAQQVASSAVSASQSDAQIIEELERMRDRIQQLEEQLKERYTTAVINPASSRLEKLLSEMRSSIRSFFESWQGFGKLSKMSLGKSLGPTEGTDLCPKLKNVSVCKSFD